MELLLVALTGLALSGSWVSGVLTDHARLAVDAAVAMTATMRQFNAERAAYGAPPVSVGIGLNTGVMSVGNMGSDLRRAYTVIGDAVNLASRLEGATKEMGCVILASEACVLAAGAMAACGRSEEITVKGRSETVRVFEVLETVPGEHKNE